MPPSLRKILSLALCASLFWNEAALAHAPLAQSPVAAAQTSSFFRQQALVAPAPFSWNPLIAAGRVAALLLILHGSLFTGSYQLRAQVLSSSRPAPAPSHVLRRSQAPRKKPSSDAKLQWWLDLGSALVLSAAGRSKRGSKTKAGAAERPASLTLEDPLPSMESGAKEEQRRLQRIPVDQLDRYYAIFGDFDLIHLLNDVLGKPLLGTLHPSPSPDLIFSKHSLFREAREVLREVFENRGIKIYQYKGADEFAGFYQSSQEDPKRVQAELQEIVAEFTKRFSNRYWIYRLSDLSSGQLQRLEKASGVLVIYRQGHPVNVLIDADEWRKNREQFEAYLQAPKESEGLSLAEKNIERIDYEYPGRGLLTLSVGAVSAREVLDLIHRAMRIPGDLGSPLLKRNNPNGPLYVSKNDARAVQDWMMRVANDMLAQAKEKGRNQAFVPSPDDFASNKRLLHVPVTSEKIEKAKPRGSMEGKDAATGLYDSRKPLFREEVKKQTIETAETALLTIESYHYDRREPDQMEDRAFHQAQEGNAAFGDEIIKELAEWVRKFFPKSLIARRPPDQFIIASSKPLEARDADKWDEAAEKFHKKFAAEDLNPYAVLYKVSNEALGKIAGGQASYFPGAFAALNMMNQVHHMLEVLSSLRIKHIDENNLALVSKGKQHAVIDFDPTPEKTAALLEAYRNAIDSNYQIASDKLLEPKTRYQRGHLKEFGHDFGNLWMELGLALINDPSAQEAVQNVYKHIGELNQINAEYDDRIEENKRHKSVIDARLFLSGWSETLGQLKSDLHNASLGEAANIAGLQKVLLLLQAVIRSVVQLNEGNIRGIPHDIDVQEAIRVVAAAEKMGVEFHVEGNSPKVWMDPNHFMRVPQNLISNAKKAGANRVDIYIKERKGEVLIRMEDNGKGVPENKQPLIFERGFSGSRSSGLGLAIVRSLLKEAGGRIEVNAERTTTREKLGKLNPYQRALREKTGLRLTPGTAFDIYLPAPPEPSAQRVLSDLVPALAGTGAAVGWALAHSGAAPPFVPHAIASLVSGWLAWSVLGLGMMLARRAPRNDFRRMLGASA